MTSGARLEPYTRRLIFELGVRQKQSAEQVWQTLFSFDPAKCTIEHLKRVLTLLRDDSKCDEAISYLAGSDNKGGRPLKLDTDDINLLIDFAVSMKTTRLRLCKRDL